MQESGYQEFGWSEAGPMPYHKYISAPIINMLPTDGSPILDIGCGNGSLTNDLIDKGFCVYGIDASSKGIDIANRRNPGRFFVNDIADCVLPEQLQNIKFSTIISTEVIEHLYNPIEYIKFIKEILTHASGGTCIISTPYHGYIKNLTLAIFGKMDYHFSSLWVGGHIKFWSHRTIAILLSQEGFSITQFKGVGRIPKIWKHMIIEAKLK